MAANKKVSSGGQTTIVCSSSMDISGAGELRLQLMDAINTKESVVLDAAKIEKVDTAALQILTAFFKDADATNIEVQWKDPTQALTTAASLLGLNETLRLT